MTEALTRGEVSAKFSNGRRCTLQAPSYVRRDGAISINDDPDELNRLKTYRSALNTLAVAQERTLIDMSKNGLRVKYLFDFDKLIPKLNRQILELEKSAEGMVVTLPGASIEVKPEKEEVNPFARKVDPYQRWTNEELCQIVVNASLANKNIVNELKRRGKECDSSGNVLVLNEATNGPSSQERERLAKTDQLRKKAEDERRIAEAERARKKAEDERRIAEAERARQQAEEEKAKLLADREAPSIQVTGVTSQGALGKVSGLITDDGVIDFVMAEGQILELNSDGSFEYEVYIPRTGKKLSIVAIDESGKRSQQTISVDRSSVMVPKGPQFAALNPAGRPVKINRKAAALIVGIAEYERTPAPAVFADKDAQYFYDYAALKLGVPEENIFELINEKADRIEFKLAVRNWLTSISDADTDFCVFFAGHGVGSDDGNSMFLLPYDGTPALLEDSAIRRDQLFEDIAALKPNSVTVFLDTCYSGSTRGSEVLIAARPVLIKVNEQDIPDGFTVFTAASGDQTAKPLPEVEQGLFSYFLMKGLEGDADLDSDGQILAGELHEFTRKNVSRLSVGSQTPEFQGDSQRVLVTFQ